MKIESLLSARLFLVPQTAGKRAWFVSNLSGKMSLYAMDLGGSVPEPLLPPDIALQNPELVGGSAFCVFPGMGTILVMIDRDGDENYQPMLVPMDGGYPRPAFGGKLAGSRVYLCAFDRDAGIVYLLSESRTAAVATTWQADLKSGKLARMAESEFGCWPAGFTGDHRTAVLYEEYTTGDAAAFLWERGKKSRLLFGTPWARRTPGDRVVLTGFRGSCVFVDRERCILATTTIHDDRGGVGRIDLSRPQEILPVRITGVRHSGDGELTGIAPMKGGRLSVSWNIDGCSWIYDAAYEAAAPKLALGRVVCGSGALAGGVVHAYSYEKKTDRFAFSFSTATSPTQIITSEGAGRKPVAHTRERILGVADDALSAGEDASFTSFDGTRVSARLYRPSRGLAFRGPRPLVYYVHGGPQGQERPDFSWFSMPLIQFLTMRGFAVFVPNARGSTGYGLAYTKQVDRDWGGKDRLDHVHAMTRVLPRDRGVDVRRAGVVGRSYGGYMSLTLASRHPDLWKAAVDMFGPYDLATFSARIPATWKPYFKIAVGDPGIPADLVELRERSPSAHIERLIAPLLVIQGANDPRVVEAESRDVVAKLKGLGRDAEIIVFPDEGHDVLKFAIRVTCYNAIAGFFEKHLGA